MATAGWMACWVPIGSFLITALISFIVIGLFRFSVSWFSLGGLYISRSLFIWHSLFSKGLQPAILSFSVFQGTSSWSWPLLPSQVAYLHNWPFYTIFLLSVYMTAWDLSKHERLAEVVVCFSYIIQSMFWGPSLLWPCQSLLPQEKLSKALWWWSKGILREKVWGVSAGNSLSIGLVSDCVHQYSSNSATPSESCQLWPWPLPFPHLWSHICHWLPVQDWL